LAKNTQVNYCFTKEFECCAVYKQEAPEEPPPLLLAWIESVRLWMGNRRLSAKSAHPPQDTGHPQEENRLPQTEIILPLSTISLPETKDTPADQEILLPMTENLIPMEENVLLRSASERTWDKNARPWVKKARPLAVALVVPLLLIVAALVWWPMPGTSIEESTGNAAPLQEIVQPEDHVQSLTTDQSGSIIDSAGETAVEPESSGQPTVSRQIEAPKDRSAPALVQPEAVGDAFDSRIEAEAPAAETEETAEKASGGFRVQIYD
jgi:hypothetical protein